VTIDLFFLLAMVLAVIKGFRTGFIIGLFSFIAYFIGLAAALKLSSTVANYLSSGSTGHSFWIPVLSFLLVFIGVVFLVNVVGRILKSVATFTFMGWLDKAGGIILFGIIYVFIFSILIFYAVKISLIGHETIAASKSYSIIEPIAPAMINFLGNIIPFFKNTFNDLQSYFVTFQ